MLPRKSSITTEATVRAIMVFVPIDSAMAAPNVQIERGTLRLFHQRREFSAAGQRISVDLQNFIPRSNTTSFSRHSWRDRPDEEAIGGISKDVFHRLAGRNRYRNLLSATVHNKRE